MNSFCSATNPHLTSSMKSNFNPTKINPTNLLLWLDANDPYNTGVTPTADTRITTWKDKSGRGSDATATNAPTSGTIAVQWKKTVNGIPGFYFDKNATSSMNFNGNISITVGTITVFTVSNYIDNIGARIISMTSGNGVNDYNSSLYMRIFKKGATRNNLDFAVTYSDTVMPFNSTFVNYCQFNGTTCTVNALVGNSTGADVSSSSSGNFSISYFAIGSNANTADLNGRLNGYVHEVVVYNTTLTNSDRQKVEGYLSWKWGLQAKLPTSHPYYNAAP